MPVLRAAPLFSPPAAPDEFESRLKSPIPGTSASSHGVVPLFIEIEASGGWRRDFVHSFGSLFDGADADSR